MFKLARTASTRVTMTDVPALLFAALLKKLHEQQRGRPLEGSDAIILQKVSSFKSPGPHPHAIVCNRGLDFTVV